MSKEADIRVRLFNFNGITALFTSLKKKKNPRPPYNPHSVDKCINTRLEMKIRWQHDLFAERYLKSG